jgi:hypothetical protein
LDQVHFVAVRAGGRHRAIRNILVPLGINVCSTEWGKALSEGLFEFRIRASLQVIQNWGQPPSDAPAEPGYDRPVLMRLFFTAYGDRIVLLFRGYDKGKDPSPRRQSKEIAKARKALKAWKASRR